MLRLLAFLAALPAATALADDGIQPPLSGPFGFAAIDCAGDFAAVASGGAPRTTWTLTVRAYMPPAPALGADAGWRVWTFHHLGPGWMPHGVLHGVPAMYHDLALTADGAAVARSSCGLLPFEAGS